MLDRQKGHLFPDALEFRHYVVRDERGAVVLAVMLRPEGPVPTEVAEIYDRIFPFMADVGYHSPTSNGGEFNEDCPVLGCHCYYDGSGMAAQPFRDLFVADDDEGIFSELEMLHKIEFGGTP